MIMKYTVKYLPSLAKDIHRISEALNKYPAKARRLMKEMDEKLLKLETMPKMWPVFHEIPKYRRMVLEDHLLFYRVDDKRREVKACRIFYHRADAARHLES